MTRRRFAATAITAVSALVLVIPRAPLLPQSTAHQLGLQIEGGYATIGRMPRPRSPLPAGYLEQQIIITPPPISDASFCESIDDYDRGMNLLRLAIRLQEERPIVAVESMRAGVQHVAIANWGAALVSVLLVWCAVAIGHGRGRRRSGDMQL